MKLKKILTAILCATLTLSLAGCGSGSDSNKEESKNALEKVQDAGVLKVAVSPDFAPYEFMDPSKSGQDTYVGADIEMIKYIAEKLGVKMEILAMDFDTCLAGHLRSNLKNVPSCLLVEAVSGSSNFSSSGEGGEGGRVQVKARGEGDCRVEIRAQ